MLSPKTQYNLANAKSYFEEHLCVGDYYSERERVEGEWLGLGAAMLGLSGAVTQDQFLALCDNLHPTTGKRLTQRQKSMRRDSTTGTEIANRRVFYDFTLSPPKSVSIAALALADERITAAHRAAVRVAASELEQFATTRVHEGQQLWTRPTENVVAALFQHETSRALDPHLHTHCILFNATHDSAEGRWKALQTYGILAAQKYVENVYYHEIARALRDFGYSVVNSSRGDFELAEIPKEIRERFSKRHREIDEKTRELLMSKPAKRGENISAIRENIAHKDRARKAPPLSDERLRESWLGQLSVDEQRRLVVPEIAVTRTRKLTVEEAVSWAEEHLFERRSVVREQELWRHALSAGRGAAFSLSELKAETARRDYIRTEGGKVSQRDVLAREWEIVEMAREGARQHAVLAPPELRVGRDLAPDQKSAFEQILASPDFVTLFRGGAGTGKSYVLRRIQEVLAEMGYTTVVLAPQRQQVIDLGRDGLTDGQTVSEFLHRGTAARGAIVIVDEAGQIGGKQLLNLLQLVQRQGGRVILSGDTRQHGPVEVSDALRAIENYSGLHPAELNEIRRQDPARGATEIERERILEYREAVQAAAEGDSATSFQKLDALGAIIECGIGEQSACLAESCLQLAGKGESVLVVSQVRSEVRAVNETVRARLIAAGIVRGPEQSVTALEALDLSNAQKADARYYPSDAVVTFRDSRASSGARPGKVIAITAAGVALEIGGKIRLVPRKELDRFTVCQPREMTLREGDRLQLKTNGKAGDGRRLANGEIVTVAKIAESGAIRLADGRVVPAQFRQFVRGYAVTSYGSQGKTVDHVLFGDSCVRAATNAEQWYVTISRGRKSVRIFTANKAQLAANIARTGHRELALDLIKPPKQSLRVRKQVLRGIRRGRDLARRICEMVSRRGLNRGIRLRPQNSIRI